MSDVRIVRVSEIGARDAAAEAAEVLARGELAIMPTDTVYGLAASLDHPEAISAVFRAKNRPADMPLPVLVASADDAHPLVAGSLAPHEDLLDEFWPGALTVIVPASERVPREVIAGGSSVGLRQPDSDVALAILRAAGGALAVTSANISGQAPACQTSELPRALLDHVEIVIDAGPCPGGTASTVLDLSAAPPRILREGPVTREQLTRRFPDLQ